MIKGSHRISLSNLSSKKLRHCAYDPGFSRFVTIDKRYKQTTYYDNSRTLKYNCNIRLKTVGAHLIITQETYRRFKMFWYLVL